MTENREENRKGQWKIISYSNKDGLTFMTVTHVKSGICLGSEPVIPDNINSVKEKNKQHQIIKEFTKQKILKELERLGESLRMK